MAAWQTTFHLISRRALAAAPQPLTPELLNDTDWWTGGNFPPNYHTRLAAAAAPAPSTSPELERWGDENGSRIDVHSGDGGVRRVTVRVDVRRLDSKFSAALILLVRASNALLVRSDGLVVEPKIDAYAAALRTSSAWQYASELG